MAAFSAEDMRAVELPAPINSAGPAPVRRPAEVAHRIQLAESLASQSPHQAASPIVLRGLVRLLEFFIITATGFGVHQFWIAQPFLLEYLMFVPGVAVLTLMVFQALGVSQVAALRTPVQSGLRIAGGWTFVLLLALAVVFFLKIEAAFSRIWLVGWWVAGLAVLLASRVIINMVVRRLTESGRLDRRTVIVGGGAAGEQVLRDLTAQKHTDLRICGVFDDRDDDRSPDVVAGFPKLGRVDDLVEFARHTRIDLVIFTLPITAESRLLQMLRKLWVLPIDIRLAAHANKLRFRPRSYSWIGSVPVLDVFDKPIADWDVVIKNVFDRVVGALCLLILSPVMLAVAIAVKLDSPGPILFRQKRHGFNNENIDVFKFRSMFADQLDPMARKLVTRGDPRVTRVGRFIRRTSLDELPQLFNVVFKGNLSLVGPRPHAIHAHAANQAYDDVVDGYFARHRVRPGLTGWAQVHGWRGETDTDEKIQKRVEYDLFYIENWSILLDIYILALTPFALIKGENAF